MRIPAWGIAPRPKQMKALLALHPRFSRENDPPVYLSSMQRTYDRINRIHSDYKRRFRYEPDSSSKGDVWQPPIETEAGVLGKPILAGDCEDFVFGMADEMEASGFLRGAMLAVTAKLADGRGHMMLAIHNDWTTLISDVRFTSVPYWNSYSFRDCSWRRIQKPGSVFWQWCFEPTLAQVMGSMK